MNESSFDKEKNPKPASENGFMKLNQARANAFATWNNCADKKASIGTNASIVEDHDARVDAKSGGVLPVKDPLKDADKAISDLTAFWYREK